MAGRRHHILPRFLLKGFAKEVRGDQIYAWEYAKGRNPLPTNINNVGVEVDFYGGPTDAVQADAAITELEQTYGPLVDGLRASAPGPVRDLQVASFVAHLSSRTKNLRLAFQESADQLLEELGIMLSDEDRLVEVLRPNIVNETYLRQEVLKHVPQKLTPAQERQLLPMMRTLAEQFLRENKGQIVRQMAGAIQLFRGAIAQAAAKGQNQALLKFDGETPKAKLWEQLHWRTETMAEPLLLGDSGCLFALKGDPQLHPYPEDPKNIAILYLPLTKQLLLIGSARKDEPAADTVTLNEAAALCSRYFYASALGPEQHGHLQPLIGTRAVFFSRDRIAEITRECFGEMGQPPAQAKFG
ncbi:MAG TPA: DUF4238 domain-containing protein [Candidatus Didemnitutus sp.]|jgi:hypothetical protein